MTTARKLYDLAVIGGGSGGVAAALAAARMGASVILVEHSNMLGGIATRGGVNCWEMGAGGTGIPFDIYQRIRKDYPAGIGIYSYGRHFSWQAGRFCPDSPAKVNFPGGELLIDPARQYLDTLRRHPGPGVIADEAWKREHWHGVPFLLQPMADTLKTMLDETGNVHIKTNITVAKAQIQHGSIKQLTLSDGSEIDATLWVDACDGNLCRSLGCETLAGVDPKNLFDEPSAPDQGSCQLNAVTLLYKIEPGHSKLIEPLTDGIPDECWWADHFPVMSCAQNPDMTRTCNMLPTMEGREAVQLEHKVAYAECKRRVKAHWHFIQTHWPEFREYRLIWIAPILGVREGHRVICEKMLTENDINQGLSKQSEPDIITIADHAMDRHGESSRGCLELDEPYGVPFRCLIPKGWSNLLVACRAAGFSSIAASSCRLTRTIMQLGQAAGTAAAMAARDNRTFTEIDPRALRDALRKQYVQLDWPISDKIKKHLIDKR